MHRFVIDRRDLRDARWEPVAEPALADGSVRLSVELLALTANNITYAAFGDAMRYWNFFPTGDAATGCVPAWGFATVDSSRCDAVLPGERVYGFWPMAQSVTLLPARVDARGFVDGALHRRELHPVYNHYRLCRADAGHDPADEAEQALLQPLFTTAFLIDDELMDGARRGARQVLLGSASSKTAYATAFCLARHGAVEVVGLTSPANLAFARSLGCYARVLAYDELTTLDPSVTTAYVDMSGSAAVRAEVHHHFGDRLVASCAVGATHWEAFAAPGTTGPLPGARPTLFFAPARVKQRQADWGAAGLQQRIDQAWNAFIGEVRRPARPWLEVHRARGRDAAAAVYRELVDGRGDPRVGHLIEL